MSAERKRPPAVEAFAAFASHTDCAIVVAGKDFHPVGSAPEILHGRTPGLPAKTSTQAQGACCRPPV